MKNPQPDSQARRGQGGLSAVIFTALAWAATFGTLGSLLLLAFAQSKNDHRGFANPNALEITAGVLLGFFGAVGAGLLASLFATLGLASADSSDGRCRTPLVAALVINVIVVMGCLLAVAL